jgi:IS30 family transposase
MTEPRQVSKTEYVTPKSEEEIINKVLPPSQNITLSTKDQTDIERIKLMLLEGKSQLEISVALNLARETVNRKIQRWIQTPDFELWLKTAWLDKYQKVDDETAFEALTKLLSRMVTQKREVKEEIQVTENASLDINVFNNSEQSILNEAARILNGKSKTKPDSLH